MMGSPFATGKILDPSRMRILHSADWQIGMRADHAGNAAERVRSVRLESARKVMDCAHTHRADVVVLVGDTFEHNAVDRSLVQRVADILARAPCPVLILPGNHDPAVSGSVWEHPAWKHHPRARLLKTHEPFALENTWFWPCPARSQRDLDDPTMMLSRDLIHAHEGIHVVLAHGTVEGIVDDPVLPIARNVAERLDVDYLALGHWHSTTLLRDANGRVRTGYSGTHEPTRFGERDSGNVLLIEIEAHGAEAQIISIPTGALQWTTLDRTVQTPEDVRAVHTQLEQWEHAENTLMRVRLQGLLHANAQDTLLHLSDILAARFLLGRVDISALRPAPDDDGWIAHLPPGVLRETATRLRAWSDPAFQGARPSDITPDIAAWALLELYQLGAGS